MPIHFLCPETYPSQLQKFSQHTHDFLHNTWRSPPNHFANCRLTDPDEVQAEGRERNTDHLWWESCWRPYLLQRLRGLGLKINPATPWSHHRPGIPHTPNCFAKDCALVDKMQQMGTAGDPQRHGCSLSTPPMWALFHKLWWFITSFVLATNFLTLLWHPMFFFPFCTSWHFSRSQNWDASWTRG